jgi:26S proteasome regulatory subunit T2
LFFAIPFQSNSPAGTLEEFIDENHVIVSTAMGPEYYVNLLSFVDRNQLEPGSTVLMHHKAMSVIGILGDDVDPMVREDEWETCIAIL